MDVESLDPLWHPGWSNGWLLYYPMVVYHSFFLSLVHKHTHIHTQKNKDRSSFTLTFVHTILSTFILFGRLSLLSINTGTLDFPGRLIFLWIILCLVAHTFF